MVKGFWNLAASILRLIPWWVWFWLFVATAAWSKWHGDRSYAAGQAERQGLWDAASTEQEQRIRQLEAEVEAARASHQVQIVERVKTVHVKGATTTKLVPQYIPVGACDLPAGFRVLHDAASRNEVPDAAASAD